MLKKNVWIYKHALNEAKIISEGITEKSRRVLFKPVVTCRLISWIEIWSDRLKLKRSKHNN